MLRRRSRWPQEERHAVAAGQSSAAVTRFHGIFTALRRGAEFRRRRWPPRSVAAIPRRSLSCGPAIPLPDNAVDVIISNCVINLSGDKDRVMREAFRVLKPGGRLAVADVVIRGEIPAQLRRSMELWVGCIAGALEEREYREKLAAAGFECIAVEPTRIYQVEEAREFLTAAGFDADAVGPQIKDRFMSAFIRAKKAVAAACHSTPGSVGLACCD